MNGPSKGLLGFMAVIGLIALFTLVQPSQAQARAQAPILQRFEGRTWKGTADRNYLGFYSIVCKDGVLSAYGYEDGKLRVLWSKRPEGMTFVVVLKNDGWMPDETRTYEISEDGQRITERFKDEGGGHQNSYVLQ